MCPVPISALLLLTVIAWAPSCVSGCGTVEEGRPSALRCITTNETDFTNFGVWAGEPTENPRELSVCGKDGNCVDKEPNKYVAKLTSNDETGTYSLLLSIQSVSRNDTTLHCVKDQASIDASCSLEVYVKPEQPVCNSPRFIQNGAIIYISLECTADRVFPDAVCAFTLEDGVRIDDSLVIATHQPSTRYPDNKEVTCTLRLPVSDYPAGDYRFLPAVRPDVSGMTAGDYVNGDAPPPITLRAASLLYQNDNGAVYNVKSGDDLSFAIKVVGSPAPNQFSLLLRPSEGSSTFNVPIRDYAVSHDDSSGELRVRLSDVGNSGVGFGTFTFRASNGVNGTSNQLEYRFTITEKDGDDDDDTTLIVGVSIAAVVVLVLIIVAISCCVYRKGKKAGSGRGRDFDGPNNMGEVYIYPNMGFQPEQTDYNHSGKPVNPPPYSENVYSVMNEYLEITPDVTTAPTTSDEAQGAVGGR